jgi:hypothetical protein
LFEHSSLIVWGRLITCGGLVIRLVLNRKIVGADYQSAAGYQPVATCPTKSRKQIVAAHKEAMIQ